MNHTIVEMGQRFARCACAFVSTISAVEYAERSTSESENLLLDRHAAHAANCVERGR